MIPFCLYHLLTALHICSVTVATRLVPHMPSVVLYKANCMPGSFYAAMDKPSQTFTLQQLHIWKRLVQTFLSLSRMGRFSSHDITGLAGNCNSRGYGVMLQYFVGGSSTASEACSGIAKGSCLNVSNSFRLNYYQNQQLQA